MSASRLAPAARPAYHSAHLLDRSMQLSRRSRLVALAGLTAACASSVTVPPIVPAPSGEQHVGKVVWRDLTTTDAERAMRFYGGLLGWTFTDDRNPEPRYITILHQGVPIGGIVPLSETQARTFAPQWVSLLSVTDVDAAILAGKAAGATVSWGPRDIAERGRMALLTDPQGALVGLVTSSAGDPPDAQPTPGGWLWTEYWADSVDAAIAFYSRLAGYERGEISLQPGRTYTVLRRDGRPRAGVVAISFRNVRPQWLPYVFVENPAALAERVDSLGGEVLVPASSDLRGGSVAVVADPSGAPFVLQRWPPQ